MSKKIKLDGIIDFDVWQQCESIGLINADGSPSDIATIAFAAHDNDSLAFTFIINEPKIKQLRTNCVSRDQLSISKDDSIEMLLKSGLNTYGFIINSKGVVTDYMLDQQTQKKNYKWNSHVSAKAWMEKNRWLLQVKISARDLGLEAIAAGTKLEANFYRNHSATAQGRTCWHPDVNYLKSDLRFGTLVME